MDKIKKYAGYAGWGFLGGYIYNSISSGEFLWLKLLKIDNLMEFIVVLLLVLLPTLGGLIGGALIKKRWGAILGGTIANFIIFIVIIYIFKYMLWDIKII